MQQPAVTTVILAGGQGSRIGGNKALQILRGRQLIEWVFSAVRPQSAEVLISASDNQPAYAHFRCPVIADHLPGYAGPLAGLQAAMQQANCEWVASVPCDTPYLPDNLIARLMSAAAGAEAAVAVVDGRRQPAIALYRKNLLPGLDAYLNSGERKVGGWLDTLQVNGAVFQDNDAFININTIEELEAAHPPS